MPYLCVHCDERFEADASAAPRCPKCLRVHGLRALAVEERVRPVSGRTAFLGLGVLLLAGGTGWAYWQRAAPREVASPAVTVALAALAEGGDEAARLGRLFEADDAIEAFAEHATDGRSDARARAQGVGEALRARARAKAFVPWSRSEPRDEPVRVAAETLAALARDGARLRLYPLEVVSLAVAALRAEGVEARVAEAFGFPGEKAPPDPSGRIGFFVVAVPEAGGHAFFDPTDGREGAAVGGDHVVLDDTEALGAALGLEASSLLARNGDPKRALALADAAVKLAPRSPSVRVARANALLTSAGIEEATRELEAASQLRDDGPRHHALALFFGAKGDRETAQRELSLALERAPDYAAAHATLALLQLSRSEREEARLALERARALDPDLPALPLAFAQLHASAGEVDQALVWARQAVERSPKSPEAQLAVAGLLRGAGRYDEMRKHAREALALVHPSHRARTEQLIRSVLGPTALDPASGVDAGASPSASGDAPRTLQLDEDLKLGDGPPKLRLREPGQKLELSP